MIYSSLFQNKWDEWRHYRKEIRKPYKSTKSEEFQLKWFIKMGFSEDVAIEIINTSIRNGWIGLFEPKNYNNGGQQTGKTGTSVNRVEAIKQRRLGGL